MTTSSYGDDDLRAVALDRELAMLLVGVRQAGFGFDRVLFAVREDAVRIITCGAPWESGDVANSVQTNRSQRASTDTYILR